MSELESTKSRSRPGPGIPARLHATVRRFAKDADGATAIEYGLIAGLTFLTIVTALRFYADRMTVMYEFIGSNIAKAS